MTKQERKTIATSNAPGAIGPYSQAVQFGDMIITSGQLGMNAAGEFPDSVSEQTKQSLTNVKAILEAAEYAMEHVVKTTVFLKDMNDFQTVNEVYATFFAEPYPARSAVEVAKLPKGGLVEIEVIAVK
jgi:2-iminobutanoate/2-iminopropanoate deaminase